eukprot:CAMPEP_0180374900 /NCGR_PEP_ID=MMETSP0989-20121125/22294_1 /TAXON_ID=697907 /ORGANISM="non described non described, Strain CCMP2293" /LENGTH=76 /DNA_ID=CAMNT_0022372411 /DNA_START=117 /DNA_END=347 /DNA_ORIENTATION=+
MPALSASSSTRVTQNTYQSSENPFVARCSKSTFQVSRLYALGREDVTTHVWVAAASSAASSASSWAADGNAFLRLE